MPTTSPAFFRRTNRSLRVPLDTNAPFYEIIAGDVLTMEIPYSQHKVASITAVYVYQPDGDQAFVVWSESGLTVYIESNVSLLNHTILIT